MPTDLELSQNNAMVPAGPTSVQLPNGEYITFATGADAQKALNFMRQAQAGGRQNPLITAADAAQGVSQVFQGLDIRREVQAIAEERRNLRQANAKIYDFVNASATGPDLAAAIRDAQDAQSEIDRRQTLVFSNMVDAAFIQAGGSAVKVFAQFGVGGGGGYGGGGGNGLATAAVGVGLGAILLEVMGHNDDLDSRRRRRGE